MFAGDEEQQRRQHQHEHHRCDCNSDQTPFPPRAELADIVSEVQPFDQGVHAKGCSPERNHECE
jgi:hypothetical protein